MSNESGSKAIILLSVISNEVQRANWTIKLIEKWHNF